jgi:hypothetical protein
MHANPESGSEATSQITSGQDSNHRNSGELTLTLTRKLARFVDQTVDRDQLAAPGMVYP